MSSTVQIQMLVSTFAMQLPSLLVCLAACVVVVVKWQQGSRGSIWALLGFGLALIICVAIPIVQSVVQPWIMQSSETMSQRAAILSSLSVLWSLLRAVTYGLLLVAVFAGRSTPQDVRG